jgi:HemY protein
VSPVSGRLDAFQWLTPVAALPSEKAPVLEAEIADEPALPAPLDVTSAAPLPPPATTQDNEPMAPAETPAVQAAPAVAPVTADVPPPVFRPRRDIEKPDAARIPAVIPIVRAPDDPGVADETVHDEFDDPDRPEPAQQGGWKGFLSRLVS